MKNKLNLNCLYLVSIAVIFFVVSFRGFQMNQSLEMQFEKQFSPSENEAIMIILFLPLYLIKWLAQIIAIKAFHLFAVTVPFIGSIVIFISALLARFLFYPKNNKDTAYKILSAVGYLCALIAGFACALCFLCVGFPFGAILAIACYIFLFRICSKGWSLTFEEITDSGYAVKGGHLPFEK